MDAPAPINQLAVKLGQDHLIPINFPSHLMSAMTMGVLATETEKPGIKSLLHAGVLVLNPSCLQTTCAPVAHTPNICDGVQTGIAHALL